MNTPFTVHSDSLPNRKDSASVGDLSETGLSEAALSEADLLKGRQGGESYVMVIDPSDDSREVLQTLLSRFGTKTLGVSKVVEAIPLLSEHELDLLVVDTDNFLSVGESQIDQLRSEATRRDIPIVVLGTNRPRFDFGEGAEFVRKPYHYGVLLLKIQGTLSSQSVA